MKKKIFYALFRYSWSIPVLGEIYGQGGARFVVLHNLLGMSRSVLTQTLGRLVEDGYIKRNPGYGHPLRPEYILTVEGKKLGPLCRELYCLVRERCAYRLIHSRWALPILYHLLDSELRFSQLKSLLSPVTSRALSEELKLLTDEGYLERKIIDSYPPTVTYLLTVESASYITVLNKYRSVISG